MAWQPHWTQSLMNYLLFLGQLDSNSRKLELEGIIEIQWSNTFVLQMRMRKPQGTGDPQDWQPVWGNTGREGRSLHLQVGTSYLLWRHLPCKILHVFNCEIRCLELQFLRSGCDGHKARIWGQIIQVECQLFSFWETLTKKINFLNFIFLNCKIVTVIIPIPLATVKI